MSIRSLALFGFLLIHPMLRSALAGEILLADGRREAVEAPRKDSKGRWTASRDGRRTVLKPGHTVVVIDDDGIETVLIPALSATEQPETETILASLRDTKNASWVVGVERLAERPTQGIIDGLMEMSTNRKKELRGRAYTGLAALRTREGVLAAANAILDERDAALRRESASLLFSVREVLRRSDAAEAFQRGIADKDAGVRVAFALLAPIENESAITVLRDQGLKNRDHHIRESSALALGRRGDVAGEKVLVSMLARKKLPGFGAGDQELMSRMLSTEKVMVCQILGAFGTKTAISALRKATKSQDGEVRAAAEAALAKSSG